MKDTIYLYVTRSGVDRMRKTLGDYSKGEVPVKLNIEIPNDAFQPPVVEQHVFIDNWNKGVDVDDVRFEKSIITEEEAAVIRERRLEKMRSILMSQGYTVTEPEAEGEK